MDEGEENKESSLTIRGLKLKMRKEEEKKSSVSALRCAAARLHPFIQRTVAVVVDSILYYGLLTTTYYSRGQRRNIVMRLYAHFTAAAAAMDRLLSSLSAGGHILFARRREPRTRTGKGSKRRAHSRQSHVTQLENCYSLF